MSILNGLLTKNKEHEQMLKAEKRERNFQREQNTLDISTRDDQTYFQDQETKVNLLMWQQNLDDDIKQLCYSLLGFGERNGKWEKIGKPMCNQEFIQEVVLRACKPFMGKNLINSNWSEKMILTRLKSSADTIADAMSDSYDRYGIEFTKYDTILMDIKNTMTAAAYRSWNGWTKKIDSTMIKRIESMNEQQQQEVKQKGLWGLFANG